MAATVGRPWRPVVLVAEDDADLRDALADLLRAGLGARVVAVGTARAALAVLREAPPDVVVLDAGLPGLDGWALARDLKADPEMARIPLVGLSGIGAGGGGLARAVGFDAYLGKEQVGRLAAVVRGLLWPVPAARRRGAEPKRRPSPTPGPIPTDPPPVHPGPR
jgi:CheY-like chemotaxis protein